MDHERLEKLDLIKSRINCSYTEADAALDRAGGDVVKAIIDLEQGTMKKNPNKEEFWVKGNELVDKVKDLIKKGNVTRVIVKNEDGRTIVEIPVTVGVVGTVIAPYLAILGGVAALVTKCKIEIERRQGSEENSPVAAGVGEGNNNQ